MIMKMSVMISRISFLLLNKYWECHVITECLKNYSWSKHVKQINEVSMVMRNMWWHFRFLSVRQIFFRSDSFFFILPDRMSDKLSWIFDMSGLSVSSYMVSSTNKTDCHDIDEILLKVALNTINKAKPQLHVSYYWALITLLWQFLTCLIFVLLLFSLWILCTFRLSGLLCQWL